MSLPWSADGWRVMMKGKKGRAKDDEREDGWVGGQVRWKREERRGRKDGKAK